MGTNAASDGEEDEVGVTVDPLPLPRKPSFRNGRRVSETGAPAMHVQVAPTPEKVPSKSSPHGKVTDAPGPESPTSIAVDAFFGGMPAASKLLAGL